MEKAIENDGGGGVEKSKLKFKNGFFVNCCVVLILNEPLSAMTLKFSQSASIVKAEVGIPLVIKKSDIIGLTNVLSL